ncbi:hypothetical protein HPP92_014405 [Vanilla planifolia]|uniref:Uncharacterized protein n=1 Tax=Vanilla planifolia TaxID=51239 RepID=A0A835QRH1_VANPL|nr:hypothetical protein HPP92_014405 [Vanilla planifolia]
MVGLPVATSLPNAKKFSNLPPEIGQSDREREEISALRWPLLQDVAAPSLKTAFGGLERAEGFAGEQRRSLLETARDLNLFFSHRLRIDRRLCILLLTFLPITDR